MQRFQDKCVFVFYTEIKDGHQKWWENDLGEKLPVDSYHGGQIFVEIDLSRPFSDINLFFAFYAEIQDDCQKWQENDFWEYLLNESAETLRVKKNSPNSFYLSPFLRYFRFFIFIVMKNKISEEIYTLKTPVLTWFAEKNFSEHYVIV